MPEENILKENIREAAYHLKVMLAGRKPRIGIILGSGLGPLADTVQDAVTISFGNIPHMKKSTVIGHKGQFVCGNLAGKCVIIMQGRLHGYEGNSAQEVAFPVWIMHEIGVDTLITTNAAGAINQTYAVGDFCVMSDHINFTGRNPIAEHEPGGIAFRFFSMKDAYDPALREVALNVARREGVSVQEGVYLGLLGPSFETPAEIRAFRAWGADTVAMSVCEETIAARHVGIRVLGISLISNMACGVDGASPSDEEVFQVTKRCEPDFCRLVSGIVGEL